MIEKVINTIEKYKMLNNNEKVVVGVSGGPDSISLLHVLITLKLKYNLTIYAAHINHNLRGKESNKDQKYVEDICKQFNIELYTKSADIKKLSKEKKISLEEAGREVRYDFFNEILNEVNANKIAVAHNANDNVETILMRIMRGTGMDGLVGIKPVRDNIIRPLIEIEREEIENYCSKNNLKPRTDLSNLSSIYTRNKVRLELIPYIKKEFNSNIINTINKMSKLIEIDNNYINNNIDNLIDDLIIKQTKEYIIVNLDKINKQPFNILSRILRKLIEKICGNLIGIENVNIEETIKFINNSKTGSMLDLPKGIKIIKSYDNLEIWSKYKKSSKGKYIYNIDTKCEMLINEINATIKCEVLDIKDLNTKTDKFTQVFDYDKIGKEIYIRNRNNSDEFIPKGMQGTKKLKNFFIDEKVPRELREITPLLISNNEIAWVIGYRTGEKFKVDENTKKVLIIKVKYI